MVDGGNRCIHVYVLGEEGKYPAEPFICVSGETVNSALLEGLSIELDELLSE